MNGYIRFETKTKYDATIGLVHKKNLHVLGGISTISGYVRIAKKRRKERLKVSIGNYTIAYKVGLDFYAGTIDIEQAREALVKAGLNDSTGTDLVYNLKHLLKGTRVRVRPSTSVPRLEGPH